MKTGEGEVWSQRGGTPPSRAKTRWGNGAFHGPGIQGGATCTERIATRSGTFSMSPPGLAPFHPLTFRRDDRFRHPSRGHLSVGSLELEALDELSSAIAE